jgi:hypothetical protein
VARRRLPRRLSGGQEGRRRGQRQETRPAGKRPEEIRVSLRRAIVYEFERQWTIEQVIGYVHSTSIPVRRLLGDRRAIFEKELTEALARHASDHRLMEPVCLAAVFAFREA